MVRTFGCRSLTPSAFFLEFRMNTIKTALVACVMTTAVFFGLMNPVQAQTTPATCVNDYTAEIAAGLRSAHYPRCLDAHSPRGATLQGVPAVENQAFNCPSGQVFSGGVCVTLNQNQGGPYCGLAKPEDPYWRLGAIFGGWAEKKGWKQLAQCNGQDIVSVPVTHVSEWGMTWSIHSSPNGPIKAVSTGIVCPTGMRPEIETVVLRYEPGHFYGESSTGGGGQWAEGAIIQENKSATCIPN